MEGWLKQSSDDSFEPYTISMRIPNLLINGAEGIAVGMATSIPPHNLEEVINAVKAYIQNPAIDTGGLMKYIKGPDFPTGGIIINKLCTSSSSYEVFSTWIKYII